MQTVCLQTLSVDNQWEVYVRSPAIGSTDSPDFDPLVSKTISLLSECVWDSILAVADPILAVADSILTVADLLLLNWNYW